MPNRRHRCRPLVVLSVTVLAWTALPQDLPNLARGRPYTLTPAPNYALCTDSGDRTQLTDGEVTPPTPAQIWTRAGCVGWRRREPVEIVIDLGEVVPIGAVLIHTGAAPGADVYLPDVLIAVSDDGEDFRVVRRLESGDLPQPLRKTLRADALEARGRHVLVRLSAPYGQYVFADEVEVLRGTHEPDRGRLPEERLARLSIDGQSELQKRLRRGLDRLEKRLEPVPDMPFAAELASLRQRVADLPSELKGKLFTHSPGAAAELSAAVMALQTRAAQRLHPAPRLALTAVSPWAELLPGDVPGRDAPEVTGIEVLTGQNEWESQAFVVSNLSGQPAVVTVQANAPASAAWQGRIDLRYAPFIQSPEGFPIADALPLLDQPLAIPPWEIRLVWIGIHSGETAPGDYEGVLTVGGATARRVALKVHVLPARIPAEIPLATYSWQYVDSIASLRGLEADAVADLKAHYSNVAILSNNHLPRPDRAKGHTDADGNIIVPLDFSAMDRWVQLLRPIAGRGMTWFPSLRFDGTLDTPEFTTYRQWVRLWLTHLQTLGLSYDDVFVYPVDESIQEDFVASAQAIRRVDPELRIFANPMMRDREDVVLAAVPYADIWCPLLSAAQPGQLARLHETGKPLWSYTVCRRQSAPYGSYRLAPWKAFELGATGCGFWCYAVGESWKNGDFWHESSALYAVIYTLEGAPAEVSRREKIITSRRWEAWREGVEDYTWLWMLRGERAGDPSAMRLLDTAVREVLANPDQTHLADEYRQRVMRALVAAADGR